MESILLGLVAITVLSIIILVHEFGHFIVAKKSGVWVEEFGLGLPPRVFGKKFGDTLYSINALPLGGFVRLHGETLDEPTTDPKRAFVNKPKRVRIAVALAGIFMNFILAIVCFVIVYSVGGIKKEVIKITEIAANSPAEQAGVQVDDRIFKINGNEIITTDEVGSVVGRNKGKQIEFTVQRIVDEQTQEVSFEITPRLDPPEGEGAMGIAFGATDVETVYPPLLQRPIYGIKNTFKLTGAIFGGFVQISQDVSQGEAPEGVLGPVGIFAIIAEFFKRYGILGVMELAAIISLNLAVFNLIPFPPLDGSRVAFIALESVVGRKRLPKIEAYSQQLGMLILIVLFIVMTANELPKLLSAGSLSQFVESIIPQ